MANLTARADWKESPGHLVELQIAAGEVIFDGSLVGVATTASAGSQALVTRWLGTNNNLKFLGVARIHQTSASATGDSVTGETHATLASAPLLTTIGVDVSGVILREVTLATGSLTTNIQLGSLVFAPDDNLITTTADVAGPIGWITKVHAAGVVDVKLFTPGEHMGGVNTAVWSATAS